MADYIIAVIKKLGLFTVVAQTLLHFCPNKSYEKYIKILIGTMSITLVAVPILGIFESSVERKIQTRIEEYGKDMEAYLKKQNATMTVNNMDIQTFANSKVKSELNKLLKKYDLEVQRLKEVGERLVIEVKGSGVIVEEIKLDIAEYFQIQERFLEVVISE